MRIRYFFTNKQDKIQNNLIWASAPRPLCISHVREKLESQGVIDSDSHLRFLDKIKGEKVWLDITNDDVECPVNSEGVVDIKIVQQFHVHSQAFLTDVFKGVGKDNYLKIINDFQRFLGSKGKEREEKKSEVNQRREEEFTEGYVKFKEKSEDLGSNEFESGEAEGKKNFIESNLIVLKIKI